MLLILTSPDMSTQERKNKNIGLIASAGIHGLILAMLFFLIAWRAPEPSLPEYGIQLNFGLDTEGTGDVQPEEIVASNEEKTEEGQPKHQEEQKETQASPDEAKVAEQLVSDNESPVKVKEQKKETTEPAKDKPVKEEKPVAEYKKEEKKESKTDSKTDGGKTSTGSHGDDTNKKGDKGNPEGSLDSKALYGNQGGAGGNGLALSMSGWEWADQPKIPELPDNVDGRIAFDIECDENGDIVRITTVERGLSPRAEQMLKEEIQKNSLRLTSGGRAPERSKGRIVFVLKTK
jgi:periplasmic protein TonB